MEPSTYLARMARRQGVPFRYARRLRPLVDRALGVPEPVRSRLLQLVERTLAREAERLRERHEEQVENDDRALHAIARLLHRWSPPAGFGAGWLAGEQQEPHLPDGPRLFDDDDA